MFGFSTIPSRSTRWSSSSANTARRVAPVTSSERSIAADRDHRPPLGEARSEPAVLHEALAQAVETLGDRLPVGPGQRLRAGVDLYPRDHPAAGEELWKPGAVRRGLANRLVVEDHPADVVVGARCREQELAEAAARLLARLGADRLEPLGHGAVALVRRQDALPLRDHLLRRGRQRLHGLRHAHSFVSSCASTTRRTEPAAITIESV